MSAMMTLSIASMRSSLSIIPSRRSGVSPPRLCLSNSLSISIVVSS